MNEECGVAQLFGASHCFFQILGGYKGYQVDFTADSMGGAHSTNMESPSRVFATTCLCRTHSPSLIICAFPALRLIQGVAAVAHSTIKPMNPKYYEKVEPTPMEVESVLKSPVAAAVGGAAFMPSMASHMIPASVLQRGQ